MATNRGDGVTILQQDINIEDPPIEVTSWNQVRYPFVAGPPENSSMILKSDVPSRALRHFADRETAVVNSICSMTYPGLRGICSLVSMRQVDSMYHRNPESSTR